MTREELKNLPELPGIYLFTNKVNNKHYVGQAVNLKNRLKQHLYCINHFEDYSCLLYPDINKYGFENFTFEVIEELTQTFASLKELKDTLDDLEKKYIKEYHSYGEYNKTIGGDAGVLGLKMTKEQRKKISDGVTKVNRDGRYSVYLYNITTKEYKLYLNCTLIAEDLKSFPSAIRSAMSHKMIYRKNYVIAKTKEEIQEILKTKGEYINPMYNVEEYYNYIINVPRPYNWEQIYNDLGITKDAVMKRNKKLRELGYNIPEAPHYSKIYLIDTLKNTKTEYTVKELSEMFRITEASVRQQIKRENLYKKQYKFEIEYETMCSGVECN